MEGKKTLFTEKLEKEVGSIVAEQDGEDLSVTLIGGGKDEGTNTTFKCPLPVDYISRKSRA